MSISIFLQQAVLGAPYQVQQRNLDFSKSAVPHYLNLRPISLFNHKNLLQYVDKLISTEKRFNKTMIGKSCAVIGSSSNLIGSNYRKDIDNHEMVIRINGAPRKINSMAMKESYEKDLGQKTDIHFINFFKIDANDGKPEIKADHKNQFLMISKNNPNIAKAYLNYHNNLIIWDPLAIHNILKRYGHKKKYGIKNVSGGLKAITLAMTMCEKVDVYGFGKDKDGKHGYYIIPWKVVWDGHNPDGQELFLKDLASEKQINLFMGTTLNENKG